MRDQVKRCVIAGHCTTPRNELYPSIIFVSALHQRRDRHQRVLIGMPPEYQALMLARRLWQTLPRDTILEVAQTSKTAAGVSRGRLARRIKIKKGGHSAPRTKNSNRTRSRANRYTRAVHRDYIKYGIYPVYARLAGFCLSASHHWTHLRQNCISCFLAGQTILVYTNRASEFICSL